MNLIFITDNPNDANIAARSGVDYIMIDLEFDGKHERQGHLNTLISNHCIDSIALVKSAIKNTNAKLLVRTNPLGVNSSSEINAAIDYGAEKLMLPMFRCREQVVEYLSLVDKRVPVTLLVETATAYARLPTILDLDLPFDIHVGLNDLHLEMKLDFMFELLIPNGVVEHIANLCRRSGRAFGIGGVSRLNSSAELSASSILLEHIRLGSTAVILSREWRDSLAAHDFDLHVDQMRIFLESNNKKCPDSFTNAINNIVNNRKRHR